MRSVLATLLVTCLGAADVHAAPSDPAPTTTATDPALDEAQELYTEGLTHYETLDYDLAIESWKRALGRLRDADASTPEQVASVAAARNAIVYNIARAQEKAFEQDHDVARLKKAKGLLEVYVGEIVESETDEIAKANARIEQLAARIEAAEKEPPAQPTKNVAPPEPPPDMRRGTGLVGGGAALLVAGIGLVAGGVTVGALMSSRAEERLPELDELADEQSRRDELARGKRGDTVLIACAASGGVLVIGATAMLVIGARRMKIARAPRGVATPMLGRGFAGIAFSGRF